MWNVCGRAARVHEQGRGSWSAVSVGEMCLPHAEERRSVCVRGRERAGARSHLHVLNLYSSNMLDSYLAYVEAYRATDKASLLSLRQIWNM